MTRSLGPPALPRWRPKYLRLSANDDDPFNRRHVRLRFGVIGIGLLIAGLPTGTDRNFLKSIASLEGTPLGPTVCFLAGVLCLAVAVVAVVEAAQGTKIDRLTVVTVGVLVLAPMGPCLRYVFDIVFLRELYEPWLIFQSSARAAAVFWGCFLVMILACAALGPLVVTLSNCLPRKFCQRLKITRWVSSRHVWLVAPFPVLAAVVIVSQWVIPAQLSVAMGYQEPTTYTLPTTIPFASVGAYAWSSLDRLSSLTIIVGIWIGVEVARGCHALVSKGIERRDGFPSAVPVLVASVVVLLATGVRTGNWLGVGAGILLGTLAMLSIGRVTSWTKLPTLERTASKWKLPEEFSDAAPFGLILFALILPIVTVFAVDVGRGVEAGVSFPIDAANFFRYWQFYGAAILPSASVGSIFVHGETIVWISSFTLGAVILFGSVFADKGRDRREVLGWAWFFGRLGVVAALLVPISRLADSPLAALSLVAAFALPASLLVDAEWRSTMAWLMVSTGLAVAIASYALWEVDAYVPAVVVVLFTTLNRFAWNAGPLNDENNSRRFNQIAWFQGLALLAAALLVLDHGAAPGYFSTSALSSSGDRIGLSVVAVLWVLHLANQEANKRRRRTIAVAAAHESNEVPWPDVPSTAQRSPSVNGYSVEGEDGG